jgi:predicted nucleic acid-binding protein
MGATLLINDRRPSELARNLGLAVVSCPGMIVVARSQQLIPAHMAHAMLRMCAQHGTAPAIIQEASLLLSALETS